jgi:UDP-N-acetyl-2-amino-2-deoxyglucuronate dehydrogenase
MTLRLAIVGVGWAGTRQAQAVQELGESAEAGSVEVVALVDNDADFLAAKAAELGVGRVYTRVEDALADPEIDALSICTPHPLHAPMALVAARAGKHVLVEKPIALSVDEATHMIEAAEANGVTLYVAENEAYTARARFLRQLVHSGEPIGAVTTALLVAGFRSESFSYPGRRDWLTRPEAGGTGTWMLHGIHSMAELRAIFGEVETVYLRQHKTASFQRRELEGTVTGVLTLASGPHIAIVQSSETKLPGNLGGYVVHGERGSVRAGKERVELFLADSADPHTPQIVNYPQSPLSEYAQEIAAFAAAVQSGEAGLTGGRSERRTLAIVQAGYESMETGLPVHLRERFGPL